MGRHDRLSQSIGHRPAGLNGLGNQLLYVMLWDKPMPPAPNRWTGLYLGMSMRRC